MWSNAFQLIRLDVSYVAAYDRETGHFKALAKREHTSAIADHVKATGHNIKWDHF